MLRFLILPTLAMFILCLMPTTQASAAAGVGRIVHAYGPTWVQRGTVREKAVKGTVVLRNDTIITGNRGRVKIIMGDGSKVYVGAKSRISLRKYSLRGTKLLSASINMLWGKARFFVNKLTSRDASFSVRTSTAVLGVRGTEFIVIVPPTPELLDNPFATITLEELPQLPTRTILTEGAIVLDLPGQASIPIAPGTTADVQADGSVNTRQTEENDFEPTPPAGEPAPADEPQREEQEQRPHQAATPPPPPPPTRQQVLQRIVEAAPQAADLADAPVVIRDAIQNLPETTTIRIEPSFVEP